MKIFLTTIMLATCLSLQAQESEPSKVFCIYDLAPFDRAVCCIKYYEGIHRKKDYPYVGYGHLLQPGERYSSNMSLAEAEVLLRKDLKELCSMFRAYGKDSLLLATLAYNVGPYTILGNRGKNPRPKSSLLKKIESGMRNFNEEYVQFCRWKGKKIPSIERRRYMELMLLYVE